jgi:hypothetical protein
VGKRVGQRGNRHRTGEATVSERSEGVLAEEVGGGAPLLVVRLEQEAEQRLRAATGERRSLHLRGDEPPDGEAFGSLMRLFTAGFRAKFAELTFTPSTHFGE